MPGLKRCLEPLAHLLSVNMYYWIYNVILHVALPIIIGLLLVKKRLQRGLKPRFGVLDSDLRHLPQPVIWLHAVSLGEAMAAIPLLRALKRAWPHGTLVVSTITETGKEVVFKQLDGVARHCYAPLDFPWAVSRYVRGLNPSLFILMESEFWPNLLRCLHRHHIPVCLVNGRISSRSYARYRLVPGFTRQVFGNLNLALVQSERDRERLHALGVPQEHVHVTGNMKFDQVHDFASVALTRSDLGLGDEDRLWVAGSTHAQEETEILQSYQDILNVIPKVILLLAPRHIERIDQIEQGIREFGMVPLRRSRISSQAMNPLVRGPRVILLDTRGELASLYRLGEFCFVGGTLVPVGGHNLLEPAQWGKPVLFGPFTDHCRDVAQLLIDEGAGIEVKNRDDLVKQIERLAADCELAKEMGRRAIAAVEQRRGVVARNVQKIGALINQCGNFSGSPRGQADELSAVSQP